MVSIRPSAMSDDGSSKDYGPEQSGFKVGSKNSIHPFRKVMGKIAGGRGRVSTQKEWSIDVARDGLCNKLVMSLERLKKQVDDISLMEDDRNLDTVLNQASNFEVGNIDPGYCSIRVWNEAVKSDLEAQAEWCGVHVCYYVQLGIMRKLINGIDFKKERHQNVVSLGKSEGIVRESLRLFDQWLEFRKTQLEFLVSQYGDVLRK